MSVSRFQFLLTVYDLLISFRTACPRHDAPHREGALAHYGSSGVDPTSRQSVLPPIEHAGPRSHKAYLRDNFLLTTAKQQRITDFDPESLSELSGSREPFLFVHMWNALHFRHIDPSLTGNT
ncbi:hypothetical protein P691DRAFT_809407 [Macrolepiota fuliginosa MF-IS2]|uniref:Uncharacterized protein n=1 Tax=Macrolepiota fuliginosa MF-IS2 TaxID=1400762 RepID=A0A9P5X348_9AGAR|nr:hypothetical protein P691DRAFT_809407 [Macrolepiota fuliginosa MF-IS2]